MWKMKDLLKRDMKQIWFTRKLYRGLNWIYFTLEEFFVVSLTVVEVMSRLLRKLGLTR